VVGAVLGLPLLFGQYYFGMDFSRSDLGMICALQRQLSAGASISTSPLIGNGLPILFDPVAQAFYPLRWLVLPFSPDLAASLEVVLHLSIGAGATAWLMRSFGARAVTAGLTGIGFALSGTALNLILHSCYSVSAAWIPVAWAAGRRTLGSRRHPLHPVVMSTALALCLLGGDPQGFGIGCGLVCLEALLLLLRRGRVEAGPVAAVGVGLCASFLIGLLLWGGALVEYSLGQRTGALDPASVLTWSLTPDNWAALILPGILEEQVRPGLGWKQLWFGAAASDPRLMDAWNHTPYLGATLLAILASGLWLKRARTPLIVAGVGMVLTLGSVTPLLPLLIQVIKVLGIFRYPAKYLLVTTLAGTVAAGIIAEQAWRSKVQRRRSLVALVAMSIGLSLALFLVISSNSQINEYALLTLGSDTITWLPFLASVLVSKLLHALGFVAAGALALWARRRWWLAAVTADLLVAAAGTLHFGPPLADRAAPLSTLVSLEEPIPNICQSASSMARQLAGARTSTVVWRQALRLRETAQPYLQACDGLSHADPYSPIATRTHTLLNTSLENGEIWTARALGCTHLVAMGRPPPQGVRFVPLSRYAAFNRPGAKVFEVLDAIPHAFAVRGPTLYQSEEAALGSLPTTTTTLALLRVVDDPLKRLGYRPTLPSGLGVTSVDGTWPVWDQAVVSAYGSGGAVLGIRRVFAAGWTAEQAGRNLAVVRTAGMEVAAIVDDVGRGPVTFRYEPPRQVASRLAGLLGLGLNMLLLLNPRGLIPRGRLKVRRADGRSTTTRRPAA
jgi:hypothetical protein